MRVLHPVPGAPDHFSDGSAGYAAFRPTYPDALFDWIGGAAPGRALAWDAGTGSGQAAVALADRFDRVVATDLSGSQIAHALPHVDVTYRVAPAEQSGLPDASVDAVTAAQALHWFATDAFYDEVRRVLRPGGLVAAWTYGNAAFATPAVGALVDRFYAETVGPDWPPERAHVESGYASLPFPFARVEAPALAVEAALTLDGLAGYLRTWSATARYRATTGVDPVDALVPALAGVWGDARRAERTRWPLTVLAGRAG
ncbi:MAG TPA: class I SAM-dependent methyltransferase [Rubricoccaceae bacterium]|jgi:SAM-dependent methyltransferase